MQSAHYYRDEAMRARLLAHDVSDPDIFAILRQFAKDYDEIAIDLENGAIDIRHPRRMPQQ